MLLWQIAEIISLVLVLMNYNTLITAHIYESHLMHLCLTVRISGF